MIDRTSVREGMAVYSADGEKLGKVQSCQADTFTIEKGIFFPKDFIARFDEVTDISGDEVHLSTTKDTLGRGDREAAFATDAGGMRRVDTRAPSTGQEQVSMPLAEEQVEVERRSRDAGEVRLRKEAVTEHRRVDVPVTREQVHVEHVPAGGRPAADASFEQREVSVPVTEEEVEIRKRPVVKEEVRLRKDRMVEQRAADVDVRSERAEIEDEGGRAVRDEDVRHGIRDDEP